MNILIVDNHSDFIDKIYKLVQIQDKVSVVSYQHLIISDADKYDLIILSGAHNRTPVMYNPKENLKELELVRNSKVPILGICYGCQVIAGAFGGRVDELAKKEIGIIKIQVLEEDPIFKGKKEFEVYESHIYSVTELQDQLIALARSKDGYEIIKHRNKFIYGFQFHPELQNEKTYGDEIFRNTIESLMSDVKN